MKVTFPVLIAASVMLFTSCKKNEVSTVESTTETATRYSGPTDIAVSHALNFSSIAVKPNDYVCAFGTEAFVVYHQNEPYHYPKSSDVHKVDFLCTMETSPFLYLSSPIQYQDMFDSQDKPAIKRTKFYKIDAKNVDELKLKSTNMATLNYIKSLIANSKENMSKALAGHIVENYYGFVVNFDKDPVYQKYGLVKTYNTIGTTGTVLLDIWMQAY